VRAVRDLISLTASDGHGITGDDGEHAAAVDLLTSWRLWHTVAPDVADHDGDIFWTGLEVQAPLVASSQRRLAEAEMDLSCSPGPATAVGLKRLCPVLDRGHLGRVLDAVCLLRPDVAPARGWGR
jgi:hypothetical protein